MPLSDDVPEASDALVPATAVPAVPEPDEDVDPYAHALGERLRRVRLQQHRSLHDVEAGSGGELKASVVGAYERGERAVSVNRLHALAAFYRVPVAELLPASGPRRDTTSSTELIIDLAALERVREARPTLARYVESIQAKRGDYNGQVLTVRATDLDTLAAVLDASPDLLRDELTTDGVVR